MQEENILQKAVSDEFKKFKSDLDEHLWGRLKENVDILVLPLENNLHSILATDNLESLMKKIKEGKEKKPKNTNG